MTRLAWALEARHAGVGALRLHVIAYNRGAVRLYAGLGCARVTEIKGEGRRGGRGAAVDARPRVRRRRWGGPRSLARAGERSPSGPVGGRAGEEQHPGAPPLQPRRPRPQQRRGQRRRGRRVRGDDRRAAGGAAVPPEAPVRRALGVPAAGRRAAGQPVEGPGAAGRDACEVGLLCLADDMSGMPLRGMHVLLQDTSPRTRATTRSSRIPSRRSTYSCKPRATTKYASLWYVSKECAARVTCPRRTLLTLPLLRVAVCDRPTCTGCTRKAC